MKVDGTSEDDVWFVGSRGLALHTMASLWGRATDTEAATSRTASDRGDTGRHPRCRWRRNSDSHRIRWGDSETSPEFQPSLNGVWQEVSSGPCSRTDHSQRTEEGTWMSDMEMAPTAHLGLARMRCHRQGDLWSVGGRINSDPCPMESSASRAQYPLS